MKIQINNLDYDYFQSVLKIPIGKNQLPALKTLAELIAKGKNVVVEIKEERKQRSLTANGAMWLLLRELAVQHNTTKEELYLWYLRNHGIFDYYAVPREALDRVKKLYRIVDEKGTVETAGGKELVRIKVYPGSSTYDVKEFGYLLDRILEDARAEGINLITQADRDLLLKEYKS